MPNDVQKVTQIGKSFHRRFGEIKEIISKFGEDNDYFALEAREGLWSTTVGSIKGEPQQVKSCYRVLSTGTPACNVIIKSSVKRELMAAYDHVNAYQAERSERPFDINYHLFDAFNVTCETLKYLCIQLSTLTDDSLLIALPAARGWISEMVSDSTLFPEGNRAYHMVDALLEAQSQFSRAEAKIKLEQSKVRLPDLFAKIRTGNMELLPKLYMDTLVRFRKVFERNWTIIGTPEGIRDRLASRNSNILATESGRLARLLARTKPYMRLFPPPQTQSLDQDKDITDADQFDTSLKEITEIVLEKNPFVHFLGETEHDKNHKNVEFAYELIGTADKFTVTLGVNKYQFNLQSSQCGSDDPFAEDPALQQLERLAIAAQYGIARLTVLIDLALDNSKDIGECGYRLGLDDPTYKLCSMLEFYYDLVERIDLTRREQSQQAAKCKTDGSYQFLTPNMLPRRISPSSGWFNNYKYLNQFEDAIAKDLKPLKEHVGRIKTMCKEGMTEEKKRQTMLQTRILATAANNDGFRHNAGVSKEIADRAGNSAARRLNLKETRDLAEIAKIAFLKMLVGRFSDEFKTEVSQILSVDNNEDLIVRALHSSPDFLRNPEHLFNFISVDPSKERLDVNNCIKWLLKLYVAGIFSKENEQTLLIKEGTICGITKNFLLSWHQDPEMIAMLGSSLASLGPVAGDQLRLTYHYFTKQIEINEGHYKKAIKEDKPTYYSLIIQLNLFRSLIGLSQRDPRYIRGADTQLKYLCIDTEYSIAPLNHYEGMVKWYFNEWLKEVLPCAGDRYISLLQTIYHGQSVNIVGNILGNNQAPNGPGILSRLLSSLSFGSDQPVPAQQEQPVPAQERPAVAPLAQVRAPVQGEQSVAPPSQVRPSPVESPLSPPPPLNRAQETPSPQQPQATPTPQYTNGNGMHAPQSKPLGAGGFASFAGRSLFTPTPSPGTPLLSSASTPNLHSSPSPQPLSGVGPRGNIIPFDQLRSPTSPTNAQDVTVPNTSTPTLRLHGARKS